MFISLLLSVIWNALKVMFIVIWKAFGWVLIPMFILMIVFGIIGFAKGFFK